MVSVWVLMDLYKTAYFPAVVSYVRVRAPFELIVNDC